MKYSYRELKKADESGSLFGWTKGFLNGPGENKGLVKRIERFGYNKATLKVCDFDELLQIAGPRKSFMFPQRKIWWFTSIQKMKKDIRAGWKPLPLVVMQEDSGSLTLADGNHRMVALKKLGYKQYEAIVLSKWVR